MRIGIGGGVESSGGCGLEFVAQELMHKNFSQPTKLSRAQRRPLEWISLKS